MENPGIGQRQAQRLPGRGRRRPAWSWPSLRWLQSPWAVPFCLVLLAPASAAALCLSERPLVSRQVEIGPDDIARAKQVLQEQGLWRPPGVPLAAGKGRLDIPARDLELLLNYLASRQAHGSVRTRLRPQRLDIEASFALPANPFGRYLDLRATLREADALPEFESLRLACLPLPGWLVRWALPLALKIGGLDDDYRLATQAVRHAGITPAGVQIAWGLDAGLLAQLRELALPVAERARLRVYQGQLAQLSRGLARSRSVSLADLLQPMLELAQQRAAGGDLAAEQRALVAVLAFHVTGRRWAEVLPEARGWPVARAHAVTLRGRTDLAQHFMVSAALAAHAGSIVADAIGLHKEVEDSRGGSGFSFADLAADRAGTVFGQRAGGGRAMFSTDQASARLGEDAIMPQVAGLPEFMQEAEFRRRFGGVGAPAYRDMEAEIERRVAACTALR